MSNRSNYQVSAASLSSMKQQRRGTHTPKKKTIIENIGAIYTSNTKRESSDSYEIARRLSWLEKVRKRSVVLGSKGKIILESRFPNDLRGVYSARFSNDGNRFVTAYGAGAIQTWYTESNDHCVNVRGTPEHGFPIMCIRFLPNQYSEKYFAAGACGTVFLCGMSAGDYKDFAREEPNEINSMDISLDGSTIVTGGKDATLRIYDIHTQRLKGKLSRNEDERNDGDVMNFHKMRVFCVKFHTGNNEIFLSGGWDDSVKIWDTRVKSGRVRDIRGPHICGDAIDIRDDLVLTGSWLVENSLQFWDFSSGQLIENITPINRPRTIDGEFLYCCQFFNGDNLGHTVVAGGSGLGCVEVIDTIERRVISSFNVHKSVQAIDTTNKYMVFGGMESTFKVAYLL